jgi:hypothetical protein
MGTEAKVEHLLARGLDSALAEKVIDAGYSLAKLASATKEELRDRLGNEYEANLVYDAAHRSPIAEDVLSRLVAECDWKCCICADMSLVPVIIHHVEEHHKTQDDSYENLALLCPQHHALAHSTWTIARHPLPPELIRARKQQWIEKVKLFKQGKWQPSPDANAQRMAFLKSDIDALGEYRAFFDRRAFHDPFDQEGNMGDFVTTLDHLALILKTGMRQTRQRELPPTKPKETFDNQNWAMALEMLGHRVEEVQTRLAMAIRDGEMHLDPKSSFYSFGPRGHHLVQEIDAMRDSIILLFNKLLTEAGLPPLTGVRPGRFH